jgi:hypothetical protein
VNVPGQGLAVQDICVLPGTLPHRLSAAAAQQEQGEAFFLVKDLLGWAGMLGGNKELREALEAAAQENSPDNPAAG